MCRLNRYYAARCGWGWLDGGGRWLPVRLPAGLPGDPRYPWSPVDIRSKGSAETMTWLNSQDFAEGLFQRFPVLRPSIDNMVNLGIPMQAFPCCVAYVRPRYKQQHIAGGPSE
jgi:hypothetical protein